MSRQSERRKQELAKAKAAAKLLKSQQNHQNHNSKSDTETKNGKPNPETNTKNSFVDFIERPGFITLFVALFAGSAAFAFFYNHTLSIWLFFLFLVGCGQGLRVELKLHGKQSRYSPNFLGGVAFMVSLIVCIGLQVIESSKAKSITQVTTPPVAQTTGPQPTNHPAWLPPELPKDCKSYFLTIGPRSFLVYLDKTNGGTPFFIPPIFPPEITNVLGVGPLAINYKDNRLYVQIVDPFTKAWTSATPDDMNIIMDASYARNYSANAYEMLNDRGIPTFQIIYDRPDNIKINFIGLIGLKGETPMASVMANARSKMVFSLDMEENLKPLAQSLFMGCFNPDEIKLELYSRKVMDYVEEERTTYSESENWSEGVGEFTGQTDTESAGGAVSDGAAQDARLWNNSSADSSGTSNTSMRGGSRGTTRSTVFKPIMGEERSSVQFRSLDEQLYRAMAALHDQNQRCGVARLIGSKAPVNVQTPIIEKPLTSKEMAADFLTRTYKNLPFAVQSEEVHKQITERERKLVSGEGRISKQDEEIAIKRKIK